VFKLFGLAFLLLTLGACVTTQAPVEDYNLAFAAIEAAQKVEAARYANGPFHKAQESFRQAQILYQNQEYSAARELFRTAIQEAEKAENAARLTKWRNGEVL
jgi:hypothetical protein